MKDSCFLVIALLYLVDSACMSVEPLVFMSMDIALEHLFSATATLMHAAMY